MVQNPAHALDDGQSKAKARNGLTLVLKPLEFLEDGFAQMLGYSGAGVADLNEKGSLALPAPQHDAAFLGIFQGVRNEILQDAAQKLPVGANERGRAHNREGKP